MINSQSKNIILSISILLLFTYTIGIAVTEFFVMVIILLFFYINRNTYIFKDNFFLYLLLISIYLAINSIIQINHNDLRISSIFHFRFVLLSLSIFFFLKYLENNKSYLRKILQYIFLILIFIFLDSFLQFLSGKNIFGLQIINDRVSGIFGSELILGSFLAKVFPIIIWLIYFSNFNINGRKIFLICFFSMYISTIYLSGERTSLFLFILSMTLFFFFLNSLRIILLKSFLIFTLFVFLTSITNFGKSDPFNRFFIKTFNQLTNSYYQKESREVKKDLGEISKDLKENIQIFSNEHNNHYLLAYYLFKQSPIFGKGPEGFRFFCRKVEYNSPVGMCSTHPHNIFMQLLSETGLVGIFFYFFGMIFVILKILKFCKKKINSENKNTFLIASSTIIMIFFPLVPSGNFFNNWMSIVSYYYIGIYIYSYRKIITK